MQSTKAFYAWFIIIINTLTSWQKVRWLLYFEVFIAISHRTIPNSTDRRNNGDQEFAAFSQENDGPFSYDFAANLEAV